MSGISVIAATPEGKALASLCRLACQLIKEAQSGQDWPWRGMKENMDNDEMNLSPGRDKIFQVVGTH
jgi:hypothetical protein